MSDQPRLDLDLGWNPDSNDVWYTPPHIFDALGIEFNLDVAAPPGGVPWVPAIHHYSEIDDGLIQPWHGRVWCNPPYSDPRPWLKRMAVHGNGIALIPVDSSSTWWHESVVTADGFCFIRGRLKFTRPDRNVHTSGGMFPSVLVAWGDECVDAVANCGLGWIVVPKETGDGE